MMKTTTLKFNTTGTTHSVFLPVTIYVLLFFIGYTKPAYAQNVGINQTSATPNASAILDLKTGNTGTFGFLPPNVALTATNLAGPITTPATGLWVYNTATAGTAPNNVTPGFYYWNGTKWIRLEDNNPNHPYGYNMQYAVGTTNVTINNNTPTALLSITFTPVHSVVYLDFSASGITDFSQDASAIVSCNVTGGTPVGGDYGNGAPAQVLQTYSAAGTTDEAGAWNIEISIPITVTSGTSVTITVNWFETVGSFQPYSTLENNVATDPTECHRTMIITD